MAAWMGRSNAQQGSASVSVKADEIGGVVTSSKGPEAGVWVIAETTDLPTRYIKEVVTDDRGRYLIPAAAQGELHGVGARLRPGGFAKGADALRAKPVDLKPTIAPDAKTAAKLYPANYWYSMLKVPEKNEFPGTGPNGNGISPEREEPGAVDSPGEDR